MVFLKYDMVTNIMQSNRNICGIMERVQYTCPVETLCFSAMYIHGHASPRTCYHNMIYLQLAIAYRVIMHIAAALNMTWCIILRGCFSIN